MHSSSLAAPRAAAPASRGGKANGGPNAGRGRGSRPSGGQADAFDVETAPSGGTLTVYQKKRNYGEFLARS